MRRSRRRVALILVVAGMLAVGLLGVRLSKPDRHTVAAVDKEAPARPVPVERRKRVTEVAGAALTVAPPASPTTQLPARPHRRRRHQARRSAAPTTGLALSGKVVAVDPGHDGGNFEDPSYIDQPVWNGRSTETCDTTGTETDGGYTEAAFNFSVATDVAADLRAEGARVVLTRHDDRGVGPCITRRAAIGNDAHADVAISIHADGGPPSGRGFTVLEPVADGVNDPIIANSTVLGADVRAALVGRAVEPISDYYGTDGVQPRDDLGGLNLSTVPKVMVECANMRNATDATLVTSQAWRQELAAALAEALTTYLTSTAAHA